MCNCVSKLYISQFSRHKHQSLSPQCSCSAVGPFQFPSKLRKVQGGGFFTAVETSAGDETVSLSSCSGESKNAWSQTCSANVYLYLGAQLGSGTMVGLPLL